MKTTKFLLPLFLAFTTICFSTVSKSQKDVLVSLYQSTNGDNWNQKWDLNKPVKNWYGVTVVNDEIIELDLKIQYIDRHVGY